MKQNVENEYNSYLMYVLLICSSIMYVKNNFHSYLNLPFSPKNVI